MGTTRRKTKDDFDVPVQVSQALSSVDLIPKREHETAVRQLNDAFNLDPSLQEQVLPCKKNTLFICCRSDSRQHFAREVLEETKAATRTLCHQNHGLVNEEECGLQANVLHVLRRSHNPVLVALF